MIIWKTHWVEIFGHKLGHLYLTRSLATSCAQTNDSGATATLPGSTYIWSVDSCFLFFNRTLEVKIACHPLPGCCFKRSKRSKRCKHCHRATPNWIPVSRPLLSTSYMLAGREVIPLASWLASLQLPHLVHLNCLDSCSSSTYNGRVQ